MLAETPESRIEFESMLERLHHFLDVGGGLPYVDVIYWQIRFEERCIRFWAGCCFWKYFTDPVLWEQVAEQTRLRFTDHSRPPHLHRKLAMTERCGIIKLIISLN